MKLETELDIGGYPVDVTIHYEIIKAVIGYDNDYLTFVVQNIEIPTEEEFLKGIDNTKEVYEKIQSGLNKSYDAAWLKLYEEFE